MQWLERLFPRYRRYDDLAVSIQEHLEERTEELMEGGMTRDEATQKARREFGNVTVIAERSRQVWQSPMLESIWADVRFALHQLRKAPGFAITAILTLALGVGATTAIFSVVKAVLLNSLPYKDPDRLVAVWTANDARDGKPHPSTAADFAAWKQRSGVFEDLAPSYDNERTLTGQGAPQLLIGYAVSANYLRILDVEPQVGRLYNDEEDRPGGPQVALLSDSLWRATFHADPEIVGKAITLDGSPFTVLGVMPPRFNYPSSVQVWTPAAISPAAFDDYDHTYVRILGRLKPGVSLAEAQKAANAVEAQLAVAHPNTDSGNRVVLVTLQEQLVGDIRKPLLLLMAAVTLVLLIACANTAGLALARDAERQKEIAVRLALGATRLRLLRQFVTESLVLAVIGGAIGLPLAFAGTHFLLMLFPNDVANLDIPKLTQIPMDRGVFLFAFAITLLTAVLSGIAPVLKAMRTRADSAMTDNARGSTASRRSNRSRNAIVISEVALSLILLTAAGLVVASFERVVNADLGFQPDHVLSLEVLLPANRYPQADQTKMRVFVREVTRRLNTLPGVKPAGATDYLPLSGFWGITSFLRRGEAPPKQGQEPEADDRAITPGYLRAMGIPLIRGRNFTEDDRAGSQQVVMVNQTFATQFYKGKDPVGEELNLGTADKPDWWRIVGIVGDVKAFGQDQPTHADIYRPFDQHPVPLVAFTIRTETNPEAMTKAAEQTLWSVDPDLPVFKAISMDVLADQSRAVRRASSVLVSAFAVLALLLACIGIYGVMAYSVTQRTQEIGVRMALGARRADVLRLILGLGLRLTTIGVLIGLVGAFVSTRLMASLLFEISAASPLALCLPAALLIAVTVLAAYLPARRAASIDPMRALRAE
ncbi:MAG TPA: ABC transporter permease [Acidobacteriaceae bacterium]|jgi:putative ABC transport system permease protein|nr:ABC transporter permease [Acidobacteriaceae bacterium]